ncbi:hypothetical protein [Cupriavidus basilensis]|uniref:Uncharacterized protein n=1 Tax=Cupriavidus basilensis TaxID=68895 RepID=A0A643FTQ4_9BURK|nr:hypothetical protein [Cupriavidus basilensis]QOT82210.1 hypothetical protein F7R26_039555 [Cupriavidus basilensis]
MPTDEDIWAITTGDALEALDTLHMEDDGVVAFTKGRRYRVIKVIPLREPAAAVVIDDTGRENKIEPDFLANFRHVRVTR